MRSRRTLGTMPRMSSTTVGPDRSVPMSDGFVSDTIDALQDMSEHYTRRIEIERRRADDLEKKLKVMQAKLVDTRRVAAGVDDITMQRRLAGKLASVENRLQKSLQKENQAETQTKKLRTTIEGLRRERMQHSRIRSQLEKEIKKQKRHLVDMINVTRDAGDARDRCQREVQVLQATIQNEVAEFELEFKDKVAELRAEKPRTMLEIERETKMGSEEALRLHFGGETHSGSMTIQEEMDLKHKSIKAYWDIAKREVDLRRQSKLLAKYDDAFEKIRAETGIQTIDEMTAEFVQAEEHNFSLINMINDLNREIESLEVENSKLRNQVQAAKLQGESSEEARRKVFESREAQLADAERKAELLNKKYEDTLQSMSGLKSHIVNIFQKVGCSDEGTAGRLLATGVTENTIMTFLGLIEQRVSEVCQMVSISKSGRPLTKPSTDGEGDGAAAGGDSGMASIWGPTGGGPRSAGPELGLGVGDGGGVAAPKYQRPISHAPLMALAEMDDSESDDDDGFTADGLVAPVSLSALKSHTTAKLQRKKAKMERRAGLGRYDSAEDDDYGDESFASET